MYTKYQLALKYIHYYLTASNGKGHGTHAPFVYNFISTVLNKSNDTGSYSSIEQLRNSLLSNTQTLQIQDYGAGSTTTTNNTNARTVSSIAKNAAKPAKLAQLLYRIVQHYTCSTIIELGTSLGLTTCYLAIANRQGRVITCEGSNEIAAVAKHNFERLFITNITLITGEFNTSYTHALAQISKLDMLYIDGNHRYQPTINYFEKALPQLHTQSIVIFDDIHWSSEMEQAWAYIKAHPAVSETIDLFFIGIVFLRKEQLAKQHFTIRY